MQSSIYPLRFQPDDRETLRRAAKASGLTMAEFIRSASLEKARQATGRAACLDYEEIELTEEAENNPKSVIRRKMESKRALYR